MAKRFSGDIRLTLIPSGHDAFDVSLKAPGRKLSVGNVRIEDGYTDLHGVLEAFDEAARQYLQGLADEKSPLVKGAAAAPEGGFHVGRSKSERWHGGPSNMKTKKGRDMDDWT